MVIDFRRPGDVKCSSRRGGRRRFQQEPDMDAIKAAVQSAATYGNASAGKDAIKLQIAEMQDVQRFRRQALADQVEEVQGGGEGRHTLEPAGP